MATNKKREALGRQHSTTFTESESLGFSVSVFSIFSFGSSEIYDATNVGESYGSKINAPETWISPLAETQAEYTQIDVDSLKKTFTDFLDALGTALAAEPEEVDNDDPRALWPATEPRDSFGAPLGGY